MDSHALPVRIAGEIAELIAVGEVATNEHLSTQRLAERFAVSRTPVREALEILDAQGLVEQRANRGYFVREISARAKAKMASQAMPAADAPAAYYKLAEDWVRDAVPPEITEQYLRERYKLTRSQLASVLNRASTEGWIERKPGYGWRLLPVAKTPEAQEQVYRFRLVVEPAGLLEPTFRLDRGAVQRFQTTMQSMLDGAIETWPAERLHAVGVEFHEELLKMSGNSLLHQSLVRVNQVRRLLEYRSMIDRKRVYSETREHLEILEIILRGEMIEASFRLRQHLNDALSRKRSRHASP